MMDCGALIQKRRRFLAKLVVPEVSAKVGDMLRGEALKSFKDRYFSTATLHSSGCNKPKETPCLPGRGTSQSPLFIETPY